MSNVLHLHNSSVRHCGDCGCVKAARGPEAARDPFFALIPTKSCERCGDLVEAELSDLPIHVAENGYTSCCDQCCTTEDLVLCTIDLPHNMGEGKIFLCLGCLEAADEAASLVDVVQ